MAWVKLNIETKLKERLNEKFASNLTEADKYFAFYTVARNKLVDDKIYDDIKVIQKGLSDHGENHIMEVLNNAFRLLGKEIDDMDPIQLYFICLLILFHDVGNLTVDRKKHHEASVIQEIYHYVRNNDSKFDEESALVSQVASKHSGIASNGSKDTINELTILPPHLFDTKIYTKKCAALLRFADELAEGPQRTSLFMNQYYNFPYEKKSIIYHQYAEITNVAIDGENERVCLTYNFHIKATNGKISIAEGKKFSKLVLFTIMRMLKVDAERKYCKYYCDWLGPFKKTSVTYNFWIDNKFKAMIKRELVYNVQLSLDDLVLPDENVKAFLASHKEYSPPKLLSQIKKAFNGKK